MIAEAFSICGTVIRSNSLGVFTTTTGTDETFVVGTTGFDTFTLLTGNAIFVTFGATPTTLEIGTLPVSAAVETTTPWDGTFDTVKFDTEGVLNNTEPPVGGETVDTTGVDMLPELGWIPTDVIPLPVTTSGLKITLVDAAGGHVTG